MNYTFVYLAKFFFLSILSDFFIAALDFVFSAPGASAFTGAVVFLFFFFLSWCTLKIFYNVYVHTSTLKTGH